MGGGLNRPRAGDVWGGLAAAMLVLPQAMAFGIALWTPWTHDTAGAALSGVVTAMGLCLASGAAFGTRGLVSAPTGPTLVLLSGAMVMLHGTGLSGAGLASATLLTVAMAGLFQALIGALRWGRFIKFIPCPVVSGFMTGTALLMVASQMEALTGGDGALSMGDGGWIPAATALVTMLAIGLGPRVVRGIPGVIQGLVAGTLAFHLFARLHDSGVPASWVVGALPPLADMRTGLDWLAGGVSLASLPWWPMAGAAASLAVLASLDTLLTSIVADVSTGGRHHAGRELAGQGMGHLLSALAGGMAGAGTTGATLVAVRGGGRDWTGLTAAASLAAMVLFLGPVAAWLPISVFAGIILHVAVFGMIDKDILLWLKTSGARLDGAIALIVTLVTVSWDLMVGVALGVALAAVEFIRSQMLSAVVHRRWNLADRTSLRRRSRKAREMLAGHPDAIVGYDLKGTLFFGTTDHLFTVMSADLKRAKYIILDMRRVGQVDLTAIRLIEHMSGMMRERGGELILAHIPKSMGLVRRKGHRHERIVPYHANVRLRVFRDSDSALEYAEERLLAAMGVKEIEGGVTLRDSELFSGFSASECAVLEPFFHRTALKAGDWLFRCGDHGEALFVILKGDVEVLLPCGARRKLRLGKFGAGMTVGEIAFLEPGERTADARAVTDCEVAVLKHAALRRLCDRHPELGMRLLLRLAHDLGQHLRRADAELRRLAS